ncbi:peptide transporter [Edwardsiella anguillarum]|uniref:peptide transporter n=1 Tax=Edwardsiella anguillarum TaxID=1821960 RepID=UPI0024B79CAE|nr:peptide transporter [Edwardsiella anguillarum]WHQ15524.1 peptide transporter [Edwardsiella anguillarum]
MNINSLLHFFQKNHSYDIKGNEPSHVDGVNLASFRKIAEESHDVRITFDLSMRQCDDLLKLGCHKPLDKIQVLCDIGTDLANRLIMEATSISHARHAVNIRLQQDIDSYIGSRANAVLDDVRHQRQREIPKSARAEIVRSAMIEGGYKKIAEEKSDDKLLSFARPGLTAEINSLAGQKLSLTSRETNYLTKEITPLICDLTYDAIVSHPEIGQQHLQQQHYTPVAQVLALVREKAERWLAEH